MRHPQYPPSDGNILHGFGDHAPGYGAGLIVILLRTASTLSLIWDSHFLIVEHPRNSGAGGPASAAMS